MGLKATSDRANNMENSWSKFRDTGVGVVFSLSLVSSSFRLSHFIVQSTESWTLDLADLEGIWANIPLSRNFFLHHLSQTGGCGAFT